MNNNLDEIGQVADTLDNLATALETMTGLSPEIHLTALTEALPEASLRLKRAVISETGEDPWGL